LLLTIIFKLISHYLLTFYYLIAVSDQLSNFSVYCMNCFCLFVCFCYHLLICSFSFHLCPFICSPLVLPSLFVCFSVSLRGVRLHSSSSCSTLTHLSSASTFSSHQPPKSRSHHQFCCPSRLGRPEPPFSGPSERAR